MSAGLPPFWETKPLWAFTTEEWEAVCDGCAKCCLVKLEDEDDADTVYFTDVACRLLDLSTCRCTDYAHRTERVANCVQMRPDDLNALAFLPDTCAYRRLDEGLGLASWHPLVSGDSQSMRASGVSMMGQVVSEVHIHPDEIAMRYRPDITCTPRAK